MSPQTQPTLAPLVRKLRLWKELDGHDQARVLALPHETVEVEARKCIAREGSQAEFCCLVLSGFVYRQKVAGNGGRSISAFHMRGDLVDLQNSLFGRADRSVQALTRAKVAFIPRGAIIDLASRSPRVGMAMWYDTLVEASIFREWVLNIARRKATVRIAHLLCEFGVRLESLGLGERFSYEFPMTQEQFADCTGLTPVHVNRSLKALEFRGLIARAKRYVAVANWPDLTKVGDFNEAYLHLPKARAPIGSTASRRPPPLQRMGDVSPQTKIVIT
jgi:CRP-like cAMP-binding protein